MDQAERAMLQIRAVLVVVRWERELRRGGASRPTLYDSDELRERSLAMLDQVSAELDGTARWHADVAADLVAARAEVERED